MASVAQRPADASNDKVIEIKNSNGFFIRKLALKTGDDDNRNKVTAACVESLGFGVRTGSFMLTWRCPRERSYEDTFVIFSSSARHDVHLNDATVERIQVLERKVDPVFPVVRQKQSKEDKEAADKKTRENRERQTQERQNERMETVQNLKAAGNQPKQQK